VSPELAKARVTEWAIRGDTHSLRHRGIVARRKLYVADNGMDRLLVIDPKTHDVQSLVLPQPVQGIAEGWTGRCMSLLRARLARVRDPKSAQITWHVVSAVNLGTVRVDKDGIVWWTHYWDEGSYFQSLFGQGRSARTGLVADLIRRPTASS